jgi:murein DD-endopeptidase MepM/ murein hydrolase activator NlpD
VDDTFQVYIENRDEQAYTVFINAELNNMQTDVALPYERTVEANETVLAFIVSRIDAGQPSNFQLYYKWRPATKQSRSCVEDVFCIHTKMIDDSLYFSLENKQFVPISVMFYPDKFENLATDASMPMLKTYGGSRTTPMFTAWLIDPQSRWRQGYRYDWQYGIVGAQHNDAYAYALPYERGKKYIMSQGPNGQSTHQGKNAYDWDMPEGTVVRAARDGFVITVIEKHTVGGKSKDMWGKANIVEIIHPDGTMGRYTHLAPHGVLVELGDRVRRNDKIALAGNTGYSKGPHLHFEVLRLTKELKFESIPLKFQISPKKITQLKEGDRYVAFE